MGAFLISIREVANFFYCYLGAFPSYLCKLEIFLGKLGSVPKQKCLFMTLQKIAKLAGVSKSTVSRVINDDPNVSAKTREKVKAVVEAQQYQLNPAARALASHRTQIIGVVISHDMGVLFDTSFYFPTILRGIAQATRDRDYALLLMISDEAEDDIRLARRIVHNQIMDGLVLVSPTMGHPLVDELVNANITFISADRIPQYAGQVSFVTVENIESSRTAVNHIIDLGRRKIAVIAGDPRIIDTHDRVEGYKLALQDAGIPYDPELVIIDKYGYDSGYNAIQRLLEKNIEFDGVYASQSTIAVGAVDALLDAGIRLPDDISLIAFDDLADAMNPRVGISTMRQPVLDKGYQLADSLINLIERKVTAPIHRFLPTELVIRDTCGGIKKPV